MPAQNRDRARWIALVSPDLPGLADETCSTRRSSGVALPSIKDSLGFSSTSLAWVVNAYLLTFGGFLLLGGRLGDLFGQRRMFIAGIALFTLSSLLCPEFRS
jgi:cyanate permease